MSNNVEFSVVLGREHRPLQGRFKIGTLLSLKAGVALKKLPLNLVLAVDCSASMTGPKLEGTRKAAGEMIRALKPEDCVTIVSFSTDATRVCNPTVGDKAGAVAALGKLVAQGVTNVSRALEVCQEAIASAPQGEWMSLVLLLSDGIPTDAQGNALTDLSPLHDKAAAMAQNHVCLSTVGLGSAEDYDAPFLEQLAVKGKGTFSYAPDPSALAAKFAEEIGKGSSAVATDLSFHLTKLDGKILRVCKVFPEYQALDIPGSSGVIHCGPFQGAEEQKFFMEVESTGGTVEERKLLCHVDVQFLGAVQASTDVLIKDTRDGRVLELPLKPEVQQAEAAAKLNQIMGELETADADKLKKLAPQAAKLTKVLSMPSKVTKALEDAADTGFISKDNMADAKVDAKKTKRLA